MDRTNKNKANSVVAAAAAVILSEFCLPGCIQAELPPVLTPKDITSTLKSTEINQFYLRGTIRKTNEFWQQQDEGGINRVYQAWYVTEENGSSEIRVNYPAYLGKRNLQAAPEVEASKGILPFKGRVLVSIKDGTVTAVNDGYFYQDAIRE